jgi:mono/diheme cytochrome c family protein
MKSPLRSLWFALLLAPLGAPAAPASAPLPARLADTGLYVPGSTTELRAGVLTFSPQYPLWSDGTRKRRWIALPPGTAIDAARVDAWEFPVGTRLWKEFGYGRRVETRMIERLPDGAWRFATYVWNADNTDATLAAEDGAMVDVADAPGGRYSVPSRSDCAACHEGAAVPVLGFSALQLSSDRDPLAPHADPLHAGATDLRSLAARGWLRNLSPALLAAPPRIEASTPVARAALGYLHGNCGHCHNAAGALTGLELLLAQQVAPGTRSTEGTLASLLGHSSRFRPHGTTNAQRVAAARDGSSILTLRMKSSNPLDRMPPLGVQVVDQEGVALIDRWISTDLQTR